MNDKEKAIARLKENPLDRERWIEAGKAMGWKNKLELRDSIPNDRPKGYSLDIHYSSYGTSKFMDEWLYNWHRLIDHLAEGGTIESYFEKL